MKLFKYNYIFNNKIFFAIVIPKIKININKKNWIIDSKWYKINSEQVLWYQRVSNFIVILICLKQMLFPSTYARVYVYTFIMAILELFLLKITIIIIIIQIKLLYGTVYVSMYRSN